MRWGPTHLNSRRGKCIRRADIVLAIHPNAAPRLTPRVRPLPSCDARAPAGSTRFSSSCPRRPRLRAHKPDTHLRSGAGDGIRTRDIQLGRLALYHLSYPRRQDCRRPVARGACDANANGQPGRVDRTEPAAGGYPRHPTAPYPLTCWPPDARAVKWSAKPFVPVEWPCPVSFKSSRRR